MDDKDDAAAKKIVELRQKYQQFIEDVIKKSAFTPQHDSKLKKLHILRTVLFGEKRQKLPFLLKIENNLREFKTQYEQKTLPLNVLRQVKQELTAGAVVKMEYDRIQSPESPTMLDDHKNASNEPITIPTERKGSKNYSYDGSNGGSSNHRRSYEERSDYHRSGSSSRSHRHHRDRRSRTPERRNDYSYRQKSSSRDRDHYSRDHKYERDSRVSLDRDRNRDHDSYRARSNHKTDKHDDSKRSRERSSSRNRYRNPYALSDRSDRNPTTEQPINKSVFGRLGARVLERNDETAADPINDDVINQLDETNDQRFGRVDDNKVLVKTCENFKLLQQLSKDLRKEEVQKKHNNMMNALMAMQAEAPDDADTATVSLDEQLSGTLSGDDVPSQQEKSSQAIVPPAQERVALKYNPKPRKRFDSNESSSPNAVQNTPSSTYTPTAAAEPQFDSIRLRTNNRDPRSVSNGPVVLPNNGNPFAKQKNCNVTLAPSHQTPLGPPHHLPHGPPHHHQHAPSHHPPHAPPHHPPPGPHMSHMPHAAMHPMHGPMHLPPIGNMLSSTGQPMRNHPPPPPNFFMPPIRQPSSNHFNEGPCFGALNESNQFAMHSPPVGPPFPADGQFYPNMAPRRQTYADHKRQLELEKRRESTNYRGECVSSTTNSASSAPADVASTSTESILVTTSTQSMMSPTTTSTPSAPTAPTTTQNPPPKTAPNSKRSDPAKKEVTAKSAAPKSILDNAFRANNWSALSPSSMDNRSKKAQFKIPKLNRSDSSHSKTDKKTADRKSDENSSSASVKSTVQRTKLPKNSNASHQNEKVKPSLRRRKSSSARETAVPTSSSSASSSPLPVTEIDDTTSLSASGIVDNPPSPAPKPADNTPLTKEDLGQAIEDLLANLLKPSGDPLPSNVQSIIGAERIQQLKERLGWNKNVATNGDDSAVSSSTAPAAEVFTDTPQVPPQADQNVADDGEPRPVRRVPRKKMNELEKLQENLDSTFIRNEVLAATGKRSCTLEQNQRSIAAKKPPTPTKPKAKTAPKNANDSDTSSEGLKSAVLLPPPAAARVLRRRNTTIERPVLIDANTEDSCEEAEDRPQPPKQPKRITRRRDTFCEVIDTPEKGDGSRAIKIKITTNKSKQSIGDATESTTATGKRLLAADSTAAAKNAKRPRTRAASPPEITGRPLLSRECKVVLEKLDVDGLKRARNQHRSSSSSSSGDEEEEPNRTPTSMEAKRLKRTYNTDPSMHSRSEPTTCALCSATPRFLVHHYVNEHDGHEVCHARMPPETTDSLRGGGGPEGVHEHNKITALCHYCEKMRSFAAKDWLLHITRHTGEYMRRCNKCNLKCADNKFKSSAQCAHDDVGIWNDIEITGNALGVFVCSLCNYSQLLESNLQKHVRQMHTIFRNTSNHYDFVELISNVRRRRGRRAPSASTANLATDAADDASEASSSVSEAEPANQNVFEPSVQGDGLYDTDTLQLMKETTFKESTDDAPGPSNGGAKHMMVDKLSERFRKQDAISDPKPESESIDVAMECPEEGDSIGANVRKRNTVASDSSSVASQISAVTAAKRQAEETIASREAVAARASVDEAIEENSGSDDNGWESCTGSEENNEDDGSMANESNSKNKMIASTLTRLYSKLGKSKSKSKKRADPKRSPPSVELKPLPVKVEKIKTEDEGIAATAEETSKTVKCVENVAFSECAGQLEFICFIPPNCKYRSSRLIDLMQHVREHDEKWSGSCLLCKKCVNDSTALPLTKEVKHLEEYHVPKANVSNKDAATGDEDEPTPEPASALASALASELASEPAAAIAARPMIKCRRVSGDRLSTLNLNAKRSSSDQLQISSAVSLSTASIMNFPATATVRNTSGSSCSGINDNPLKPWTKCPLSKSALATQLLLRDTSLVALFKCMAINCYFSTGDAEKMLQHLQFHEDYVSTQQMSTNEQLDHLSWLECSYCDTMVDTCNLLVQHIQTEHASCIYQCPYCFYRSVSTANVETHLNEYHWRKDKMIMQCLGSAKHLHAEILIMLAGREKNVVPIECGDEGCRFVCKAYRLFEYHLQSSPWHKNKESANCAVCALVLPKANMLKHLQTHHIGLFQCIYCRFGCNSIELIRLHISNMHLNELPYTVIRKQAHSVDSSNAEETCIIRVSEKSNPELLIVPPITVRQMNFMQPEITADANKYNAGLCPSDDGPSIEVEIRKMLELSRKENQERNEEVEQEYDIVSADEMLKTTGTPNSSSNFVIRSVRSLPAAKTAATTSPVAARVLMVQPAPSTSRGITVAQSPITNIGETSLTISHVACGVDFKDAAKPTIQSEIDLAARSLVKGSGFDGTDLYRCGVTACSVSFETGEAFMTHLLRHVDSGKTYTCFHCGLRYDKPHSLKNHIKSHATHRFFCYCCNTTTPLLPTMVEHFKETHHSNAPNSLVDAQVNDTIVHPLNEQRTDPGKDMFVVCPRGTSSIKSFGLNLVQHNKTRILSTKKFYTPEEVQMLPQQALFPESVACQLCGYSSKIRSNIARHLMKADCGGVSANAPGTDPVNPVPYLDTGEKHFDKMRNLAGSSYTSDAAAIKAIEHRLPHVPEERRFVCGARACHYQTQTEEMLRSHIDTLHAGDIHFYCPHCNRDLAIGKPVIAHDVLNHLRFHGPKLFKCSACLYSHYLKTTVDRHTIETHPKCKDAAIQLRPKAVDTSKTNKQAFYKWKCNVCSKTIFDTRVRVRAHLAQEHRLNYQYQCTTANCSFQSDTKNSVKEHILSTHGSADAGRVKTVYERVEGEIDVTPIWRRDDPNRIKHIRGILVEESDAGDNDDNYSSGSSKPPLNATKVPKVTRTIAPKPKLLNGTKLFPQSKNLQLGDDAQLVVVLKTTIKKDTDETTPPRQRLLLNRAAKNR